MPVGFRVYATVVRPEPTLLERFADLRTPDISDAMNRAGTMDNGIQPAYRPIGRVIGPAVTVSVPTGAFNVIKAGMQQTRRGEVTNIANIERALREQGCDFLGG